MKFLAVNQHLLVLATLRGDYSVTNKNKKTKKKKILHCFALTIQNKKNKHMFLNSVSAEKKNLYATNFKLFGFKDDWSSTYGKAYAKRAGGRPPVFSIDNFRKGIHIWKWNICGRPAEYVMLGPFFRCVLASL